MILAVDVQYTDNKAFVAGICFENWQVKSADNEYTCVVNDIAEYEPGSFYKRELPCILQLLVEHNLQPQTIVIDGYVYLDGKQKPGLGKRLYDALDQTVEVIGVAKKAFAGISQEYEIFRGESLKPLYVTATSDFKTAKKNIESMFGGNRIPVLLKRADQLCREIAKQHS